MVPGVSQNEIALVLFLLVLVLLAPKIGKIGESIGGLFATRAPGAGDDVVEDTAEDREEHQES